jgi:3-dehydroquinate dehydratase/shikimate dehydrogenase
MGLSVTIPHKQHAVRWLSGKGLPISPLAQRCGAINTLIRHQDEWSGENTDALGALAALRGSAEQVEGDLRGRSVSVLGAGGAARAIVAGLLTEGCSVTVYNRSHARSEQLAQGLGCNQAPWDKRSEYAGDVLINCTPIGLHPAANETPMPADALRPNTLVFDTVYNPPQTRLLREARGRGCKTVSGVEMFLAQAAAQFQYWHGVSPDVDRMRAAMV